MKGRRVLIGITVIFFAFMLAFTIISLHVTTSMLPLVETMYPDDNMEVPKSAVHQDEKGDNFVFAAMDTDTILGEQPVADKIAVEIVGSDGDNLILKGIDTNFEIIIHSDKELAKDDRIRRE